MDSLLHADVSVLMRLLSDKKISSVELTQWYLDRANTYDKQLKAYITLDHTGALAAAHTADAQRSQGDTRPLLGIPIAHKDLFCTQGLLTTAGSKALSNFISPYDASIVRFCREAGLVMLGKLNMDEFAMGSSNETSYYGACHNPWHHTCVSGGSSGGSATAVAARLTPLATGSDTGGSIRLPASFCGITGLKPTYGLVSRYGMVAFSSSLDQAGPMGVSAWDCAALLGPLSSPDPRDSTHAQQPTRDYLTLLRATEHQPQPLSGYTIGMLEHASDDMPQIRASLDQVRKNYESLGARIISVRLPTASTYALACYYTICPVEASSNLARFDGIHYGHTESDTGKTLEELYRDNRTAHFGAEVKRRLLVGNYILLAKPKLYQQAQRMRTRIQQEIISVLKQCTAILMPATVNTAFPLQSFKKNTLEMYRNDLFAIPANLAGLPAISFPCGFDEDHKPIGAQLLGNFFSEAELLTCVHHYQRTTSFHQQVPKLSLEQAARD